MQSQPHPEEDGVAAADHLESDVGPFRAVQDGAEHKDVAHPRNLLARLKGDAGSSTYTSMVTDETPVPPIRPETFISVDVETAGANPARFAMVSIGACLVDDHDVTFYVELKPDREEVNEQALAISGLSMSELSENGVDPKTALERLEQWVKDVVPTGNVPIFVGFNAVFDWMFVDDYFQRYLSRNPFGHTALDIKSYAMGLDDTTWAETSLKYLSPKYLTGRPLAHNALNDAQDQAELFRVLRSVNASRTQGGQNTGE